MCSLESSETGATGLLLKFDSRWVRHPASAFQPPIGSPVVATNALRIPWCYDIGPADADNPHRASDSFVALSRKRLPSFSIWPEAHRFGAGCMKSRFPEESSLKRSPIEKYSEHPSASDKIRHHLSVPRRSQTEPGGLTLEWRLLFYETGMYRSITKLLAVTFLSTCFPVIQASSAVLEMRQTPLVPKAYAVFTASYNESGNKAVGGVAEPRSLLAGTRQLRPIMC